MHPVHRPDDRLTAFGTQLIEIHDWLREELAALRDGLASPAGGNLRELRAHCLSFCSALTRHHTGEDGGAFRALAGQVPELRPVLDELAHDHRVVAEILHRVEELAAEPARLDGVRAELDGLSALLESHFGYEEKRLIAALNAMRGGTTEQLFGVPLPPD